MDININYDKCRFIDCLECLDLCPMQVFEIGSDKLLFDSSKCVGCLACQDICNFDAIHLIY